MELGELITALEAEDPRKVVPHGFGEPHCWRWDYSELAFDPAQNVTVGSMLAHARSAVGATYQGWKGGDYTMDVDSDCYVAEPREVGETLGPTLLRLMLAAGTIPGEIPADPSGGIYRERARLVAHLASLYPSVLSYADPDEPDWAVVYVSTPAGQLSWHIASGDVELFAHVPKVTPDDERAEWDGHDTATKYERLAALTRGAVERG